MQAFSSLRWARVALLAAAACCLQAQAAEPASLVLMQAGSIAITGQDMQADAQRIPPDMRPKVLSHADQVAQIASNLYVRRSMAQQAEAAGLGRSPEVQAALQLARDRVLSDALLAQIDRDNTPTDAALEGLARNHYQANPQRYQAPERVQVRHILIRGTDEKSQAEAEKLLAQLRAGADFATLAREHSADPGSAAKGGELGLFPKGQMVPEFEEAAFAMRQPGQLSDLVKTKFGYHILLLEAHKPAGLRDYSEVRDEIRQSVRAGLLQDARAAAAQKLQQAATVHKEAIEAFAAGYADAQQ